MNNREAHQAWLAETPTQQLLKSLVALLDTRVLELHSAARESTDAKVRAAFERMQATKELIERVKQGT